VSLPYVITILVTSGDPDGVRVVEKSNWTGRGVVFSRSDLPAASEQGLGSPGVYVLLGDDPDEAFEAQVYIGQGEDVGRRLVAHQRDDAKEFWTDTVVFVSASGTLNRAHILYLEARLVDLAHGAKRMRMANGNRPTVPSLSAADQAEADGFLAEMLAIFPVLGVAAFDRPAPSSPSERRYFLSGPDAAGEGVERSDGFLVFAGATARIEETASLSPSFGRVRSRLVASGALVQEGGVYRLIQDTVFKSPSTAAMVLLSRNANGRTEWKDTGGVTLKQNQADAAGDGDAL
jgi:hypothetical protein